MSKNANESDHDDENEREHDDGNASEHADENEELKVKETGVLYGLAADWRRR